MIDRGAASRDAASSPLPFSSQVTDALGYTTEFKGQFKLNKQLDIGTAEMLIELGEDKQSAEGGKPGGYCQWVPNRTLDAIEWDGGEKFYDYTQWLQYIIDHILTPKEYTISGSVDWQGGDRDDRGTLRIDGTKVVAVKFVPFTYKDAVKRIAALVEERMKSDFASVQVQDIKNIIDSINAKE